MGKSRWKAIRRLSRRALPGAAVLALFLLAGCLSSSKHDDLPAPPPDVSIDAAAVYTIGCPDVIAIAFLDWPEVSHSARVGADGCINVGNLGKIRIEGLTAAEAAAAIAERAELSARRLRVAVIEFNSRQVLVYGAIRGEPRVVDYHGPETVVELLERIGGLAPDAAPSEIHVVRAQVGEGVPAEVLPVDLEAILEKRDERTNVRVRPLDAIYVGELPRTRIGRAVPAIIKPFYDLIVESLPARPAGPANDQ